MKDSTAYIGLVVHSRSCKIAWLNEVGDYRGPSTLQISGRTIRINVVEIEAREKIVILEEGPLATWTAYTLEEIVKRTVVSDPQENSLISRSAQKNDEADAKALARLLRVGGLKIV